MKKLLIFSIAMLLGAGLMAQNFSPSPNLSTSEIWSPLWRIGVAYSNKTAGGQIDSPNAATIKLRTGSFSTSTGIATAKSVAGKGTIGFQLYSWRCGKIGTVNATARVTLRSSIDNTGNDASFVAVSGATVYTVTATSKTTAVSVNWLGLTKNARFYDILVEPLADTASFVAGWYQQN